MLNESRGPLQSHGELQGNKLTHLVNKQLRENQMVTWGLKPLTFLLMGDPRPSSPASSGYCHGNSSMRKRRLRMGTHKAG
ncbi:unnamed protein product [Boreogadus saida]